MDIRAGALCAATVVSPPHPGAGPALPESSHSSGIGCFLSCLIWLQVKHRDDQFCSFCAAALLFFPSFWHHQVSCKRLCGHWQNKRFNRFSLCTGVATLKALGMTRLICTLPKKKLSKQALLLLESVSSFPSLGCRRVLHTAVHSNNGCRLRQSPCH